MSLDGFKALLCAVAAFFGIFVPACVTTVPTPPAPPPTPPASSVDHTATGSQLGFFEDLQYLTGSALDARLDAYAATGVQWARFQLLWANVQRYGSGSFDWGPTDDLVAGLNARGIRPLAVVGTTPPWASRAAGCAQDTCGPTDPGQLAAFATAAASRYAGKIAAYEFWNEPNTGTFWAPQPSTAAYTRALRAFYPAVKQADSRATVLTGGVAPAITTAAGAGGGGSTIAPVDFLAGIYAGGGKGSFDAVGWHPYSYPAMPSNPDPGLAWSQMSTSGPSARSLMVANGDAGKALWATEFGAHTDPQGSGYLTEAQQSAYLAQGIDLWRQLPWAGPMIVYQLRDRGTDPRDRENFFGLQRFDGTAKPSYATVVSRVIR